MPSQRHHSIDYFCANESKPEKLTFSAWLLNEFSNNKTYDNATDAYQNYSRGVKEAIKYVNSDNLLRASAEIDNNKNDKARKVSS